MKTAANGAKPSYLGLLNAISVAESTAGVLLNAWAEATPNEDLAAVLRLVAARETSHGELFRRQLCELGYEVRKKSDPQVGKRLAKYADPDVSDLEKVGPERAESGNEFADIEQRLDADEFDPMTANMLTWFMAEEKDSARRLREAYACVRHPAKAAKANGREAAGNSPSAETEAIMACMTAGFSRLEKSLEKLAKAVK